MGRGGRRRAGWSAVAGNGLLTPVYPRPLIPVDGPVVVVYSRSAGNGGQASWTRSASPVRPESCPGSIVRPRALQFCLGVGKVIFNRQPVTPVAAGVCE